jgi:hypothetical protein
VSGDTLIAVATAGIILSVVIPLNGLVLGYRRLPWWTTDIGRGFMATNVGLTLIVDVSMLRLWFGDALWFQWVRLAIWTIVVAGVWFQWRAYRSLLAGAWKIENAKARHRSEPDNEEPV